MFWNIIFLIVTIVILYIGYTYKAFLFFIGGMIFNDACGFIYKIRTPTMTFNEEQESYSMNFFVDKNEYILTVPVSEVTFNDKILALSPYNKTNFIKKILGPSGNMFGMKLTPKNIGLEKLIIWKNKVQYKFKETDLIDISPNSPAISHDTNDTSESDIEEPEPVNEPVNESLTETVRSRIPVSDIYEDVGEDVCGIYKDEYMKKHIMYPIIDYNYDCKLN